MRYFVSYQTTNTEQQMMGNHVVEAPAPLTVKVMKVIEEFLSEYATEHPEWFGDGAVVTLCNAIPLAEHTAATGEPVVSHGYGP